VTGDISVTGAATYPPSGHYLLLWVNARQPNLAGYFLAHLEGRTVVPLAGVDASEQRANGREQYLDSQQAAIRVALAAAGVDEHRVSVHIRDRGLVGPSAGLAYAVALADLLTPGDLTAGRTIGVTGELGGDGRVAPIGWLLLKARGAVEDHASLLLAPSPQARSADGILPTCGVTSFRDALRAVAGQLQTCGGS
jgi:PDZ domain-containing secreted protein